MKYTVTRGRPQEYENEKGKRYWSCSEGLAVLDPHAFEGVPDAVLVAAQQRGTDLHVIFGLLLLSRLGLCEKPARPKGKLGGYYDAMEKFCAEHQPVPVKVEDPSCNDKLGVAGTPDCLVLIGNILWLIDLKTGGKRAVHKTQIVVYRTMEGYTGAKKLGTLYVRENGTYTLDYLPRGEESLHLAGFQAAVTVLQWRRANG